MNTTISKQQQRDVRRAVRIVFDALYLGWDAILGALEIDYAVVVLVTTANVACCDTTEVVATTCLRVLLEKRRIRTALVQILVHHANVMTAAC